MTTHNNTPNKRTRWSDCNQVAELALLIDAMPAELRIPIVNSAIKFESMSDFQSSYLIGEIRSLIVDTLAQLFDCFVSLEIQAEGMPPSIANAVFALASSPDPAAVQLAVCDLLECLAIALGTDGRRTQ